jgi:hypothetical protein
MLLAAIALLAASAAPPPAAPREPTEVAPVTVYPPTLPPKVVSSYPADGGSVSPGVLVLKLTFDQRMLKTGFDLAPVAGAEPPPCLKTPRLLDDGRTFVLLCTLLPGRSYALALNSAGAGGFTNVAERRATTHALAFTTTAGEPVRSLEEAMKLESLTNLDVPVQESPRY